MAQCSAGHRPAGSWAADDLCHGRSSDSRRRDGSQRVDGLDLAIGLGGSAVAGDVASLAAAVTDLASGVEGTSIGRSAVARDMALHRQSARSTVGRQRGTLTSFPHA